MTITELPIGLWTNSEKELLEKYRSEDRSIQDFREYHTVNSVHFQVFCTASQAAHIRTVGAIEFFKLSTLIHTSNMVLFNAQGKLQKYQSVHQVLDEFYAMRLAFYDKRKAYLLQELARDLDILRNKARYIRDVRSGAFT